MSYILVLKVTKFREDRLNRFELFSKNPQGAILPPPVQIGLTLFSMGYFKNTTVWGGALWPPFVTSLFLKVEGQNLVAWGILMCLLQKWHEFSNLGLLWRHYDVIIGNMECFATLLFINVEGQNLVT